MYFFALIWWGTSFTILFNLYEKSYLVYVEFKDFLLSFFLQAGSTPWIVPSKRPLWRLCPRFLWLQAPYKPPAPSSHFPPEPDPWGLPAPTHASPQRSSPPAPCALRPPSIRCSTSGPLTAERTTESFPWAVQSGATDGGGSWWPTDLPGPLH